MENLLIIEGVVLPTPSSMKSGDYDISESERNARGYMTMEMIREDVQRLDCSWNLLRVEQYKKIRQAIMNKRNLKAKFFIPSQCEEGELLMYVGDRNTPIYTYERDGNGNYLPVFKDFSVSFIEM